MSVDTSCKMQDSENNKTVEFFKLPSFIKMVDVTPICYLPLEVSAISGALSLKSLTLRKTFPYLELLWYAFFPLFPAFGPE